MKTHLVLETVAVDLLAPLGARTSTGTVMTKFWSVYMELEIWNLKKIKEYPLNIAVCLYCPLPYWYHCAIPIKLYS